MGRFFELQDAARRKAQQDQARREKVRKGRVHNVWLARFGRLLQ
jgi:hypothetical protein